MGCDGGEPSLNTGVGLVVLVDIVEGQADELAIDDCFGVIEGVAVSLDGTDEFGTAILDTIVKFAYAAYKGVTVRRAVATAEEGNGLPAEVGTLECLQAVVPVVLQFPCAPG